VVSHDADVGTVNRKDSSGDLIRNHSAETSWMQGAIPTILAHPNDVGRIRALADGVVCSLCKPTNGS
jgi:hypothetical protein